MRLASRSRSFRALAVAAALASVCVVPAYAQEEDESERSAQQRGRAAARAAVENNGNVDAERGRPAVEAPWRQDPRRGDIQRQAQMDPTVRGDTPAQQVPSAAGQHERARQAQQRQSPMESRGNWRDRPGSGDAERARAFQREMATRQPREAMIDQQREVSESEAAQRRQRERERGQQVDSRRENQRGRPAFVQDDDRRRNLRESDERRGIDARQRLGREQQERRIAEERQHAQHYHRQRVGYDRAAEQRARALQQQRRMAHYHYQQQYYQRLRQQQALWDSRRYDYYSDPFYYTPASYRFSHGGRWHQTNRYGADLLRQAVDFGYREGLRAGRADRHDQWRVDYRSSYAYQDASYGYHGRYVGHDIYSHYFRQGFEHGYQDAYYDRYRYGQRHGSGDYRILAGVLTAILGLQLLR